ncbi:MAG: hypothetical protein HY912_01250 [Desulfomonile tiedjei]|uniref:Uncharacterized protein n=1 Tax=Desulfomonile tiedjei TaxID=2358 RepID=A0A9D6UZU9_9BACT|nr:hypothetical protein [Desulfomonile tiedjei]
MQKPPPLGIDRDTAKEVNFRICFGISPGGVAVKINAGKSWCVRAKAQAYIDAFYSGYLASSPLVRQTVQHHKEARC